MILITISNFQPFFFYQSSDCIFKRTFQVPETPIEDNWSDILKNRQTKRYKKDEVILKYGTFNDSIFYINFGVLKVTKLNGSLTQMLTGGDTFGELSTLLNAESEATVSVYSEEAEISILQLKDISSFVTHFPASGVLFFRAVAKTLGKRLLHHNEGRSNVAKAHVSHTAKKNQKKTANYFSKKHKSGNGKQPTKTNYPLKPIVLSKF